MINRINNLNKIDIQRLLRDIRTNLALPNPYDDETDLSNTPLPYWHFEPVLTREQLTLNNSLYYKQLTRLQDAKFIEAVFTNLLKREPDPSGKEHYLNLLRSSTTKEEIILRVRFSREGRYNSIPLRGLVRAALFSLLKRLPGLRKLADNFDDFTDFSGRRIAINENISNLEKQLTNLGMTLEQYRKRILLQDEIIKEFTCKKPMMDDTTYAAFENQFRGTRKDIKSRMEVYLPYILTITNKQITSNTPLLDIGCGRGEWLELLQENDTAAYGIDINACFIDECLKIDLRVNKTDLFNHLQNVKNNSLGAVTAMHLIEHLPFPEFQFLLSEIKRVLVPGGMIILETPNPRNIMVATHFFHTDPSHLKPVPPTTMQFFLEQSGFRNISIHELHPDQRYIDNQILSESGTIINNNFFGPQDYAVLAYC